MKPSNYSSLIRVVFRSPLPIAITILSTLFSFSLHGADEVGYYKQVPLFSTRADPSKSATNITRFGPVGLSIDLIKPTFTMRIKSIEPGSPADKTALLKPGQIIASINGEKLKDIDPRIQLGNMISQAEATDGKLLLQVSDKAGTPTNEVLIQIPVLGKYSDSWPLNCPKSDKIVRNYAEYLKTDGSDQGFGSLGMLFLLSTGDDGDLAHVRKWALSQSKTVSKSFHTWNNGYGKLALCEYYLRTGDKAVLPAIQVGVESALRGENNGAWGNRAAITGLNYGGGGGHLNAGGVPLVTFLLLAKECGAKMPEEKFLSILRHHYRWVGRGNVPYGNNKPEGGYTDNGKNGALAFAMAAATSLTPKGENSIYAKARDVNAQFGFYSTSYMLHGHTGGGIGEIWRSASTGLTKDKLPSQYRSFMDERKWHYEMSRRHDGSFAILGGLRYDNVSWGAGYALTYTVPRKTLRITGAPASPYSKSYELPERLWGSAEDDDFISIEPIAYADGTKPDFSEETLRNSGGMQLLKVRAGVCSDDDVRRYIRHPNLTARTYFVDQIIKRELPFVMEALESDDARLRRVGLIAVSRNKETFLTTEMYSLVVKMVQNPDESWFVKDQALEVLGLGSADQIAANVDVILPYLAHQEWWLQHSALNALAPVVADKRVYQKVLPAIGRLLKTNHLQNVTSALRWGKLPDNLRAASPEVAALARQELGGAYTAYVDYKHDIPEVSGKINPGMREEIAKSLTLVPGGYDVLFQIAKQRSPGAALPYEELFLAANPTNFSPELRTAVNELIKTRLIPRYIAKNRNYLLRERANEAVKAGYYYRGARVFGLIDLYERIGIKDYGWSDFGQDMTKMKWQYHSFDPPEAMAWDITKARYRKVTFPADMENWYQPSFDPQKHGWKKGEQPFGATNGKLVGATIDGSRTSLKPSNCPYEFCRHGTRMKTLWEKEVLMLRGQCKLPEFKEDHRYRLVIGGMAHVGAGEGFKVYINGKEFFERDRGVGRREGGKPISKHIDKSWWPEFESGEVDIAAMSFMGIHHGLKHRQMTVWIQEMKLPEIGDKEIIMSATAVPMKSAKWQLLQDPDENDKDAEAGKYLWGGKFTDNPAIVGKWKPFSVVASPEDFDFSARASLKGVIIKGMEFKPNGRTADPLWIYSGDTLMNLHSNEALRMESKSIEGKDYLLIEQGGFSAKNGNAWRSTWVVMTR